MSSGAKRAKGAQFQLFLKWSPYLKYTFIFAFVAMTLAYLGLTLLPSPDKLILHQYHLTPAKYRLLLYPAIILLVISWIFTLVASIMVRNYFEVISSSRDGKAFRLISWGILVLAITQPLSSLLSNIFMHIEKHIPGAIPTLTIINNYLTLAFAAIFLVLVALGADQLYKLARRPKEIIPQDLWVGIFTFFSIIYGYFIIIQPIHTPLAKKIYFLPNWLVLVTVAAPYIFIWYVGIRAAYKVYLYQQNIRGRIYKQALNYLAAGVAVAIISSIATRTIVTVSTRLNRLSLTPLLFIVYGLILTFAIGFALIAIGANKLKKIEEA